MYENLSILYQTKNEPLPHKTGKCCGFGKENVFLRDFQRGKLSVIFTYSCLCHAVKYGKNSGVKIF